MCARVLLICSLTFLPTLAVAAGTPNQHLECAGLEILSSTVKREILAEAIDSPPKPIVTTVTSAGLLVTAPGPVLGSMDSHDVKLESSCTPEGIVLKATIDRSPFYNGDALKNITWRPRVEAELMSHRSETRVVVIWEMLSNDGQRSPYSRLAYPITMAATVHE